VGGANVFKTEGLMFESVPMGHMRVGCQAELPIISVCAVWAKGGKTMCIIWPRSHKATKAKGFRGKMWKDVKWVGRNNVREVRHKGGGRWGHIPGFRCGIVIRRRRKGRGRVRT
jgi:hypothetical protein